MIDHIKGSCPAFPVPEVFGHDGPIFPAETGMTLRDYFIAHAPAEPQPWFQPVMPAECPPSLLMDEDRTTTYPSAFEAERACGDCYVNVNNEAQEAWRKVRDKQRYVQWPAAWADAMLAAREKQS